jgi:hypothetical protein
MTVFTTTYSLVFGNLIIA